MTTQPDDRRNDPVCGYCGQVCATVSVRVTHEARHERETDPTRDEREDR